MQFRTALKKYGPLVALVFGVYTLLGLLSTAGTYFAELREQQTVPWGPLLRQEFKDWLSLALMSLGAIWFSERNQVEPGRLRRWVGIHLVASVIFSLLYVVSASWLVAGERSVMHPEKTLTFLYLLKAMALHFFIMSTILYWMVVCAHFGWHFYARYRERELRAAQLERELTQSRLEALRMQLNPHFLFNTLHAVSALIHDNPEAADRVVARLSELLRLSLDHSKPQEVPLSEEMDFLGRYLEIEQTRFAERLKVDIQIEPAARESLVPFLILQPLVENAIRHGIEPRETEGRLTISARRNNGRLELRVCDNGTGLPETDGDTPNEGIGLSNTRSRLRHLYGEQFRFDLLDADGGGLEARLEIPYHTAALTN